MPEDGKSADEIERTLQLETVPAAMPQAESAKKAARARHGKTWEDATGNDCPSDMPERTAKQLRAITRAPEAVPLRLREDAQEVVELHHHEGL